MRLGVVDGVSTSSAVVAHELGGTLDQVKRCNGVALGLDPSILPRGGDFELSQMDPETEAELAEHMPLDRDLMARLTAAEGKTIIKAAGNLGYPMGLWLEKVSEEICTLAHIHGKSFEEIAGLGADERTMIGRGARLGLPVVVTIPQLIGAAAPRPVHRRQHQHHRGAARLARLLDSADVIIESAVALTQEVHDGP